MSSPDGAEFDIRDPRLMIRLADEADMPIWLVRLGRGGFDAMPVSILATTTAAAVEQAHGTPVAIKRFRANVVIRQTTRRSPNGTGWGGASGSATAPMPRACTSTGQLRAAPWSVSVPAPPTATRASCERSPSSSRTASALIVRCKRRARSGLVIASLATWPCDARNYPELADAGGPPTMDGDVVFAELDRLAALETYKLKRIAVAERFGIRVSASIAPSANGGRGQKRQPDALWSSWM